MKKITNNTFWGKLTLIINAVLLVFFIITMVFLMKFDKTNVKVVYERANYEKAYESFVMAQHPLKQDSAEVAYYQYKLDTLQQKVASASKEEKKALTESISVTKETLSDKQKTMDSHLAEVTKLEKSYNPIKANWDNLNNDNAKTKKSFWVMAILTIVVFLAKIVVFAHYNYKNSKNLHEAADWMKEGMPAWQSYAGWFIPVYNLFKPLTFFKEIYEETDYILEDKAIVSVSSEQKANRVDNTGLHLGIWWALVLCCTWLMNFVLYKTFFTEGPLFIKANHGTMVIVAIVLLVLCILEEVFIIRSYNKKNKMLADNADKF